MPTPKPATCICDKVLSATTEGCNSSVSYVCEYLNNDFAAFHFLQAGVPIEYTHAVLATTKLLSDARFPLFAGFNCIGIKNQQLVLDIARAFKGVVDSGLNSNFASCQTLAREGLVTASLGESISRSDTLLVFGNELNSNQENSIRAILTSEKNPTLIRIGGKDQHNSDGEFNVVSIETDELEQTAHALEAILSGVSLDRMILSPQQLTEVGTSEWVGELRKLIETIQDCNHVSVIYNPPAPHKRFDTTMDLIHRIVKLLNRTTRAVLVKLDNELNSFGAENVSTWSTGFPNGVDLSNLAPRSFGIEYSGQAVITRHECDVAVLFGDLIVDTLEESPEVVEHLSQIPIVHFHWKRSVGSLLAPDKLIEIKNLSPFPDDFTRFDDTIFGVEQHDCSGENHLKLSDFLANLASGLSI